MLYIRVSLIPDAHVQYVEKYLVAFFVLGLKKYALFKSRTYILLFYRALTMV